MKLTHLRDLVTVAQQGGLRRAARHLGIAQPAITRSIRELEHELGATLFERTTTGMVLTTAGESFFKRSVQMQLELEKACDEVRQLTGVARGTVSVGLSTAPHVSMLPSALGPFQRRYPDVLLQFTEGLFPEIEADLRTGAVDFYIGPLWEAGLPAELSSEKLFDNRRIVMGRKGSPYAGVRSLGDLTDARWVATSVTASSDIELHPLFESYGLPAPKISVRAHTSMSMIMVAASSDLLAMVPQQWLGFARGTGRLIYIPLAEELPAPPICLVTKASLPLTPAAQHLADLFRRAALNRSDDWSEEPAPAAS